MPRQRNVQKNKASSAVARAKARNRTLLIFYGAVLVGVIVAAILLCIFVFFKVDTVEVTGSTIYTSSEVVGESGIAQGDNLVFIDSSKAEEQLKKKFPYIEDVEIKKKIPSTVTIEVTEAQVAYSVPYKDAYIYASKTGKILEVQAEPMSGSILVKGGEVTEQDGKIAFTDISSSAAFKEIAAVFAEKENTGITEIDVTNIHDIYLIYEGRLKMKLGNATDLTYKLNFGLQIVSNSGIGPDERGELDLSLAKEVNKAYFAPEVLSEGSTSSSDEGESTESSQDENAESGDTSSEEGGSAEEQTDEDGGQSDGETGSEEDDSDGSSEAPQRGSDIPDV